jgi:ribosome-associated protein
MNIIKISTEYIKLDQLMKFEGLAENGGHAKEIIGRGDVTINGEIETRRGRKIYRGYIIKYEGKEYTVE